MNNRIQYILPKNPKKIILEALSLAQKVVVDQLDCSVSWIRQDTDKSVEDVLKLIDNNDIKMVYNFIYRDMSFMQNEPNYWDVGFFTVGEKPKYFLWITLDEMTGFALASKYKLKERK